MPAPSRTRKTIMKSIRLPYETEQIITLLSEQHGEAWASCARRLLAAAAREALSRSSRH